MHPRSLAHHAALAPPAETRSSPSHAPLMPSHATLILPAITMRAALRWVSATPALPPSSGRSLRTGAPAETVAPSDAPQHGVARSVRSPHSSF